MDMDASFGKFSASYLGIKQVFHLNAGCCDIIKAHIVDFWPTVCKTVCLCYQTTVLPVCLSVRLVYCGQTVRPIKMKLGTQVGLGPGHTVLYGDPGPLTRIFGPYLLWPNGLMVGR